MKKIFKEHTKGIKITLVMLFLALMTFNVTMVMTGPNAGNVDLSLSGLKAMAQTSGEVTAGCQSDADCAPGEVCSSNGFCVTDPNSLYLGEVACPTGSAIQKCKPTGAYCNVHNQGTCN